MAVRARGRMLSILFSALLLGRAIAAAPKSVSRIVGGTETTVEQYPYMVNVQFGRWNIWWSHLCGGSLITRNAVLSAAHCFLDEPASVWRAVVGTSFKTTGGISHSLSRIVMHQGYNHDTVDNDIAVLHLLNPVTLSASVGVARIAGPNYNLPDGTTVTAVGWGTIWYNGPSTEQLLHVDIDTINHDLCVERYAYLKTLPGYEDWPDITDSMLCAGILDVGGKDACHGDSGGPLVHAGDILVGVTSWGFECADPFYPGVFARVSVLSDWIVANSV